MQHSCNHLAKGVGLPDFTDDVPDPGRHMPQSIMQFPDFKIDMTDMKDFRSGVIRLN
jgi:hypothetical protein